MSDELAKTETKMTLGQWGDFATASGIVPTGTSKHQAMGIVQAGKEMGLQPLQSLRTMNFIKGRLAMKVELQLAMARHKGVTMGKCEGDNKKCTVTLKRGEEEVTCEYTIEDGKTAGLVSTGGNWAKYPRQMLRWRAIGDALRLIAPDIVLGLLSPEEAESLEETPVTVTHEEPPMDTTTEIPEGDNPVADQVAAALGEEEEEPVEESTEGTGEIPFEGVI